MADENKAVRGLTDAEVEASRREHGSNALIFKKENGLVEALKSLVKEPMVLLLLVAASIYFISGETGDGIFLAAAIVLVAAISLYQDSRSRNALEKLKEFSRPATKVIRNGIEFSIKTEDLVVGDWGIIEEGASVPADGTIVQANDLSLNESILTGESLPVTKSAESEDRRVYRGTVVVSGMGIFRATEVGNATRIGKIGRSLEDLSEEKTPLEIQIGNFVKKMVFVGVVVFLIVWGINFYHSRDVLDSLLKALTLAMSILPEEIPVAFTTFMALGAWRLMKMGIVVKQMKTVETLGSATVICTDKTGTLTENKMQLARVFLPSGKTEKADIRSPEADALIRTAMFASEPSPFDPMETALHQAYTDRGGDDERKVFSLVHEYPLGGKPPMMTHVFADAKGNRIIAAKGAPEAILAVSKLSDPDKSIIREAADNLASEGFRLLGVAEAEAVYNGDRYPERQQDFDFVFKGLVAFYDPPRKNIPQVLDSFYGAGINVKIITGDNARTAVAIAQETGFRGSGNVVTGDELMKIEDSHVLRQVIKRTEIFSRMYPDAKLRVIQALKDDGEVVAMIGDGVNDGPALKAAHIGIAMGKKGTEIAKRAASLVLADDDLGKMVDAVAMGRRIYANLKKAIQYIISIHIPIILTVFLPLALGWIYPNIFTPVHVIFLELIMGPTCSIIYENEPMERNTLREPPRPLTRTFFSWRELATSVLQGLVITAGSLTVYRYAVGQGAGLELTRAMVFSTLIVANICLTLVNRSFLYSVLTTVRYRNRLVPLIIGITIVLTALLLFVPPLADFFGFATPSPADLGLSVLVGMVSVLWYEAVKWVKRINIV